MQLIVRPWKEFKGYRDIGQKAYRDKGYFCSFLKGYRILGSILGIWRYNGFWILGIFAIYLLGIWLFSKCFK